VTRLKLETWVLNRAGHRVGSKNYAHNTHYLVNHLYKRRRRRRKNQFILMNSSMLFIYLILKHNLNGVGESLFPHTHFTVDYNSNPQWFFLTFLFFSNFSPFFFFFFFFFSIFFSKLLFFFNFPNFFFFCFFQNYFCWFYFLNIDLVKIFTL